MNYTQNTDFVSICTKRKMVSDKKDIELEGKYFRLTFLKNRTALILAV